MDVERFRDSVKIAVPCPGCGATLTMNDVRFAGTPILVDCMCPSCNVPYWLDWPAGHALLHPTIVRQDTGEVFHDGSAWYARFLVRCLASRPSPITPSISVRQGKPRSDAAILANCVDYCFGHSLLKLFSGLRYARKYPHRDLVIVVPRNMTWLVPDAVHSVIEVDIPLSAGGQWIEGLDDAVGNVLSHYEAVIVAPGLSQPGLVADDLTELGPEIRPQAFWDANGPQPPQVTFVLREDRDRLWIDPRGLVTRIMRRMVPERLRTRLDVGRQNRRLRAVADSVRRRLPGTRFVGIGVGNKGRLPDVVEDLRCSSPPDVDTERAWLREYAQSRVVVGVHGSNMLLPSAVCGAVVNLVPSYKLANVMQDMIIAAESEHEPKLALFRYRLLPLGTSPEDVADVIVSLFRDASFHHRNMIENRVTETRAGFPRPITWHRLES